MKLIIAAISRVKALFKWVWVLFVWRRRTPEATKDNLAGDHARCVVVCCIISGSWLSFMIIQKRCHHFLKFLEWNFSVAIQISILYHLLPNSFIYWCHCRLFLFDKWPKATCTSDNTRLTAGCLWHSPSSFNIIRSLGQLPKHGLQLEAVDLPGSIEVKHVEGLL